VDDDDDATIRLSRYIFALAVVALIMCLATIFL
jgi:hypothetical protein